MRTQQELDQERDADVVMWNAALAREDAEEIERIRGIVLRRVHERIMEG